MHTINRIFCIGKNYADHVAELAHLSPVWKDAPGTASGSPADADCTVFMKPASAVVNADEPLVLPKGRGEVHFETELVVLLSGGGRDVTEDEAMDYVAGLTLGLDLTLRDLQTRLKQKGGPWELAKAFDGSAALGEFMPYQGQDLQTLEFTGHIGGELRQHGHTAEMLYPVARQIRILSQTWTLQPGDVIYTGTPKGVGPLQPGDHVVLEGAGLGRHEWRCE